MFFELTKAVLFGVVEGITEWLPISSTGHMMLLNQLMPLNVSESFYDTFIVVIQLGAIMAVIVNYFRQLNPFAISKNAQQKRQTWGIWGRIVVASIPAAIVGLLLEGFIEDKVMNNSSVAYIVVAAALVVYGIIFIVIERHNKKKLSSITVKGKHAASPKPTDDVLFSINSFADMSYIKAFGIGVFQALAVIPGTSRSGSIIIGSMIFGTSRKIATEFAFFLAIPIMFGWSLIKLIKHGIAYTQLEWAIFAVGIIVSFVVSFLVVKFLIGFVKKHDFTAFGIYRIVLGIVVVVFFGGRALGIF